MRYNLVTRRTLIIASLMLGGSVGMESAHAGDESSGAGIPDILAAPLVMPEHIPMIVDGGAQVTWLKEIKNSLDAYTVSYPSSNFAPYQTKLSLVGDALSRGDRRGVKLEMGALFKMLAKRSHGINEGAADELSNFAQMVTPIQEYGIPVPKLGAEQYGSDVSGSESSQ